MSFVLEQTHIVKLKINCTMYSSMMLFVSQLADISIKNKTQALIIIFFFSTFDKAKAKLFICWGNLQCLAEGKKKNSRSALYCGSIRSVIETLDGFQLKCYTRRRGGGVIYASISCKTNLQATLYRITTTHWLVKRHKQ